MKAEKIIEMMRVSHDIKYNNGGRFTQKDHDFRRMIHFIHDRNLGSKIYEETTEGIKKLSKKQLELIILILDELNSGY